MKVFGFVKLFVLIYRLIGSHLPHTFLLLGLVATLVVGLIVAVTKRRSRPAQEEQEQQEEIL